MVCVCHNPNANCSHPEVIRTLFPLRVRVHTIKQTSSNHSSTGLSITLVWCFFFFFVAFSGPNFPSCRLATYFPLPRRRRLPSNLHNTTVQLGSLLGVPLWFQTIKYMSVCSFIQNVCEKGESYE